MSKKTLRAQFVVLSLSLSLTIPNAANAVGQRQNDFGSEGRIEWLSSIIGLFTSGLQGITNVFANFGLANDDNGVARDFGLANDDNGIALDFGLANDDNGLVLPMAPPSSN